MIKMDLNNNFQYMNFIETGNRFPYNPKLKERASFLRKNMTFSEKKIWFNFLKSFKENYEIRVLRQRIIGNYIVDFYIAKYKLAIEIDGENHFTQEGKEYDEAKDAFLNGLGIKVLRIKNEEVLNDFENICKIVLDNIF